MFVLLTPLSAHEVTSVHVPKLINWSESSHPFVNEATKTPHTLFLTSFNLSQGKCSNGTLLFFCLSGFQGFSDYKCSHFCKKAVTLRGVTKEVGVVECMPDEAFPTCGDTTDESGTVFN